jgi:hypothetical protein
MRRNIAILVLLVICIACPRAGYSDESTPTPFDPYHVPGVYWPGLAPYLKSGNGTIEGRLAAKTKLFGETAFPNTPVYLLPAQMITWWILRSTGYNLEHDDYKKRDPLPQFPEQLLPYEKSTKTDETGYFRFTNLPDGEYYVYSNPRRVDFRHPTRYTTEGQIADNGDTVTTLEKTEGLKELSDIVVIVASATIDAKDSRPISQIIGFDIFGESTCCKAEI